MTQDGRNGAQPGHGPGAGVPAGHGQGPGAAVLGPLVQEYESTGRFRRPSMQVAAVLRYDNGGYSVMWPDRREDVNKPLFRGPFRVMEVRMGWHLTEFRTELPAAGDAESFRASVEVRWRVVDAYAAVCANVWNLAEHFSPVLLKALRGVTRRYRISEAERADRAVEGELAELRLGDEFGLETDVFVRIDLSERGISAERQRTDIDHEGDIARRQHAEELKKERREQELTRMKAAELQEVLSGSDDSRIAWFMARDKAHAWDIHQAILKERREERALSIETVFRFVDGGLIERHDLNDQTLAAIDFLRSTTSGVVGRAADSFLERPHRRELEDGEHRAGRERSGGRQRMDWAREPDPDDGSARDHGSDREPAHDDRDHEPEPGRARPGRDGGYDDGHDGPYDDDPYAGNDRGRVYEPDRVQPAAERDDYRSDRSGDFRDGRNGDRYDDRYEDRYDSGHDALRDARRDDARDDHRDGRAPRRARGLEWGEE
ncbi:hypothetical protein [Streptomyces sp. NPDC059788]|uniref:hypothetical protein n=1 Tax=Streptomyces sp. NPDC059788 TaxID=3346948 RepID=UPI003658351B